MSDLEELIGRPSWHRDATCNGAGPQAFFPERGASTAEAVAMCAGCLVQTECLDTALADPSLFGIWGGTSERARRRLRKGVGSTDTPSSVVAGDATQSAGRLTG